MDKAKLSKLQKSLLLIVDEIDHICRENNLKYSLAAGSLLGAVRHNGIIPWDDDIDIVMPRIDYELFLSKCESQLNNNFFFLDFRREENYGYGFAKICLRNTEVWSYVSHDKIKKSEIWVDVFPYDNIPDNRFLQTIQKMKCYFYKKCLEEKYDGCSEEASRLKKVVFSILGLWNKVVSVKKVKDKFMQWSTKYNNLNKTEYKTCICGYYGYVKEKMHSDCFDNIIEYDFSGKKYYGFQNYDDYLSQLYGDYMTLPPEEKRHTHNLEIMKI